MNSLSQIVAANRKMLAEAQAIAKAGKHVVTYRTGLHTMSKVCDTRDEAELYSAELRLQPGVICEPEIVSPAGGPSHA